MQFSDDTRYYVWLPTNRPYRIKPQTLNNRWNLFSLYWHTPLVYSEFCKLMMIFLYQIQESAGASATAPLGATTAACWLRRPRIAEKRFASTLLLTTALASKLMLMMSPTVLCENSIGSAITAAMQTKSAIATNFIFQQGKRSQRIKFKTELNCRRSIAQEFYTESIIAGMSTKHLIDSFTVNLNLIAVISRFIL